MKAGIYIRVSTSMQVDRESLTVQEQRLRDYCTSQGYEIHKVYREEGVSAKDTKRPQLTELLEDIRQHRIQVVLVTKLDRITRSLKDLIGLIEFFQEHDIKLISITQNIDTSGPMGRFMLSLLGAVSQVERELTAERVSEHMHHRALSGKWNGGVVTYGFATRHRILKELKASGLSEDEALREATKLCPEPKKGYIDENEAKVVRKIYDLYLRHKSIRRVAHILNSEGLKTRKGETWPTTTIVRILTSPTYIGKISFGKRKTDILTGKLKKVSPDKWKIVPGQHNGIIPEEQFNQVQTILKQRILKPSKAEKFYLLRGVLRCGRCGGALYGYTYYKKTPDGIVEYSYYRCQNAVARGTSVCRGMSVPAHELEANIEKLVLNLAEERGFLQDRELLLKEFLEKSNGSDTSFEEERQRLLVQEKQFETKKATLLEKLESGLITDDDFKVRYDLTRKQIDDLHSHLSEIATKTDGMEIKRVAMQASLESLSNLKQSWPLLTTEGKNARLQVILHRVVVKEVPTKIKLSVDAFLDALSSERERAVSVAKVYRRDRGSSPPPA